MNKRHIVTIVTLGPSTKTFEDLQSIKARGVDFVRINMSHSSLEDLEKFIRMAKKADIPFILDTEGSQVRTGPVKTDSLSLKGQDEILLTSEAIEGDNKKISIKPPEILNKLENGDVLYVDFGTLILKVDDTSTADRGFIKAQALNGGILGSNKGVVVDSARNKDYKLPPLTEKDHEAIKIGLREGVEHIAVSFVRRADDIRYVRKVTEGKMKIISKIECRDALLNIDEIIEETDAILIDRGDLSKEVPIERIPFAQKILIHKASEKGKSAFVATNLLETMIEKKKPTRAEVHDIVSTLLDGADGLTLSAETAIGKYPFDSINMMNRILNHYGEVKRRNMIKETESPVSKVLAEGGYLTDFSGYSSLVMPHGGKLINRFIEKIPSGSYIKSLHAVKLSKNLEMDVEQIGIGTFSPLEGFMNREDFHGVLDDMRLPSGIIFPLPIVLDVDKKLADSLSIGEEILLKNSQNDNIALMRIEDIYSFDKCEAVKKIYGTDDDNHPGVKMVFGMKEMLLGGKIELLKRNSTETKSYELTPKQVRRLFKEKGWRKVVGFHTRNVIHRSHEHIQLDAMRKGFCDGLFVHPVIGKKKPGDFQSKFIIRAYEAMMKHFYPEERVVFAAFSTFSRYAGPREALFTALCRKNFGCSHFIVGRDHTGVGNYYDPLASHKIFDQFPDLGIEPVRYGKVFYSRSHGEHIHENDGIEVKDSDKLHISGTQAREMLEKGEMPPDWFMRPEISKIIVDAIKADEDVFVKEEGAEKRGEILWFTGLSGSGKSTIAEEMKKILEDKGKTVEIVDGDTVRNTLNKHLEFSREDIRENNRLIAGLASEVRKKCDIVLVPIISPYKEDREMARKTLGNNFYELFINCPLEKCIQRDTKGLYKKAQEGEIKDLIGFNESNPYEIPDSPDIEIHTDKWKIDKSLDVINKFLQKKGIL